tara:strand:+ start:1074 stop:1559 length:486 start_codon:yes stop_codon:yes gene_type:complete
VVRYIIPFFLIIFIGCEINGQQIIKPEKFTFNEIKFNSVSKELIFLNLKDNSEANDMKKLISYWFDNKIKTDGFDGFLIVTVKDIMTEKIKRDGYFKFSINISIEFEEKNNDSSKTKTYKINASDYGEIEGDFSIKDQENLALNVMHQSLNSVSKKLLELN